ncbi:hypothetical protein LRS06_19685 [Hymenobacter sp. J193]|uniref:hypothetical protein n=1 Tax=Hymenobacter sp. J193 TaxID=2898429 RepID=UPI002150C1F1|nr:hypothetical protein [Hymenobacter sp. J193]MCR5889952.1 hypothetical protein [Hymenobacter sp. J193]
MQQRTQQTHQRSESMRLQQFSQAQSLNNYVQQLRRNANQQEILVHRRVMYRQWSQEELVKDQASRQQEEQKGNAQIAAFIEQQQRKRLEQPAQDAQQASEQQQEEAKQLSLFKVKIYQELFLPGQIDAALQSQTLSPKSREQVQSISKDLLDNTWWSKQDAGQLPGLLATHSNTLATLTGELLEFDIASPPAAPSPLSLSSLNEMLAKNSFDQLAAGKIIQSAAQADKITAGQRLAKAVMDFKRVTSNDAANQALHSDPKKLRSSVKESLRIVNAEMVRYDALINNLERVYEAKKAVLHATTNYVKMNDKSSQEG